MELKPIPEQYHHNNARRWEHPVEDYRRVKCSVCKEDYIIEPEETYLPYCSKESCITFIQALDDANKVIDNLIKMILGIKL